MNRRRGRPPHPDVLTPAEWRVANAIRHGMNNRAIARRLGISVDGVKYHVGNILAKLALSDRRALRRWSGREVGFDTVMAQSDRGGDDMSTNINGLGQIARSVSDLDDAVEFFTDRLRLPLLFRFPGLAFVQIGDTRLMLTTEGKVQDESVLYLRVADVQASYERLLADGLAFRGAPHRIHTHADGTEEWMNCSSTIRTVDRWHS
ncbi:MAG: LuxR C-terminal-related transcriptional regulator [Pseudomonadales bacterium]